MIKLTTERYMKLQIQLKKFFDGSRPAALFFISVAVALSALVAGVSTYLFVAAGRAQLPVPAEGEIMAPALVAALPAPTPIQAPPTAEAPAMEMLVAGPFLVTAISQPAGNESASAEVVAAETGVVAARSEKNGDSSPSASSLVVAQNGESANNSDNHDSGEYNEYNSDNGGNNAHSTAHHKSGSKQNHDEGNRRG